MWFRDRERTRGVKRYTQDKKRFEFRHARQFRGMLRRGEGGGLGRGGGMPSGHGCNDAVAPSFPSVGEGFWKAGKQGRWPRSPSRYVPPSSPK